MLRGLTAGAPATRLKLVDFHPIGHLGAPYDVAYGILYLASAGSKFLAGSELVIDGGYTAQCFRVESGRIQAGYSP